MASASPRTRRVSHRGRNLTPRRTRRLRLDDKAGAYVEGLHPEVAAVTLTQLLSNSAGAAARRCRLRPVLRSQALCSEGRTACRPRQTAVFPASQRLKYSNHGFGLLGLVIEAVTGEPYADWIAREIVAPAGLKETRPDITLWTGPMAKGHSGTLPLGRRVVIPADNPGNAMVSAAGFVATAADIARYIAQLSPKAERSILSALSRREMTRRLWPDSESSLGRHYGLGTISGVAMAGTGSAIPAASRASSPRTATVPEQGLTVSVLTNAIDGLAHPLARRRAPDLQDLREHGAPTPATKRWRRRLWTIWGAGDLVPVDGKVLMANPALFNPFFDAGEIALEGEDQGRIVKASAFASPGER
jgi:D-alanyl-D-alanine carboxypeptidase